MEFFLSILSVAVIAAGGVLIMRGELNTVDLITFSLYITTFVNPVRKLANFSELLANGTAGFSRFLELMRTEPAMKDAPDAVELTDVKGQVDVDHVSFAYEGDLDVLHDVDLHIKAGETLAVVGPSGGGKSTLCKLIPRFYDVTDGDIRIDGQDVRHVTQRSLRQQVGVVQQDVFLFADSILNNIRCGKPEATEEEVIRAAQLAEIYDDIQAMPDGLETYVGERGTLLSGGQKQRISIARIFLKNPPVLIITGVYLFFRNKYSGGVHNYAADSYILKLHYFNNRFLTSLFICLWHIRSEICVTLSVLYYCLRRSWPGR